MAYNYEWPYTDPNRYNDDWLLKTVYEVKASVDAMEEWKAKHIPEYEALKKFVTDIEKGNFPESVRDAFNKWMTDNAIDIVGHMVKNVWFGLNDNGYFVAYIPESWQDIIFNTTGLDITIADYDYGHLVLSFNV